MTESLTAEEEAHLRQCSSLGGEDLRRVWATLDAARAERAKLAEQLTEALRLVHETIEIGIPVIAERDAARAETAAVRLLLDEEHGLRKSLSENMSLAHRQLANESRTYATVVRERDAARTERDAAHARGVAEGLAEGLEMAVPRGLRTRGARGYCDACLGGRVVLGVRCCQSIRSQEVAPRAQRRKSAS